MTSPAAEAKASPQTESRRERKKQRTRRDIYTAAMKAFAERGFSGVTIEAICEAADVARATFFLHFPTKSALLFEFNRAIAAEFEERLVEPREPAETELRRLAEMLGQRWMKQAEVMRAMLNELQQSPEALQASREEDDLGLLITDIVRRGQSRGELRGDVDPRLGAAVFLATSAAILSGRVFDAGELSAGEIREQLLAVVLNGLVHQSSSSSP